MTLLLASAQLYRMIDNIKTLQFYSGLFHIIFCLYIKTELYCTLITILKNIHHNKNPYFNIKITLQKHPIPS